jgi:peptidoglycan/LPS O-acetylase OafA/YrhL
MDQAAKEQFKWKWWTLKIILISILVLIAVAFVGAIKVPAPYTLPFLAGCVILAVLLIWAFRGQYHKTKRWLDEQAEKNT